MGNAEFESIELAEDRSALANERTFAAWLRTGLAAVAVGIAFQRLFDEIEPAWLIKTGSTILLAMALVIFLAAALSYRKSARQLDRHATARRPAVVFWTLTALGLATVAVAAGVVVVL